MKQVVYTASPGSEQIHVWALSPDGALSLLQVVDAGGQVQPLFINPRTHTLYAGVKPEFRIVAWTISAEGTLTKAGEAALPGSATHISTDHHGRGLYIGYYHDGLVSYSTIDEQGIPSAPEQIISGLAGCHSSNINKLNTALFVPALKQDRICVYPLTDEGKLEETQVTEIPTASGAGPRHMAFHPQGDYAYAVNELDSTVLVIALSPQGEQIVHTESLMPETFDGTCWAADIHLTPNGKFLYASDRTSSLLTIFSITDGGRTLTRVGFQPTETQPRGFNIDAKGEYLVASGQKSDHIQVYRICPQTGKLTPLARYPVGQGPMWVTIHRLNA